ncbi:Uncharacterised protein [Mycobacteroides abscessus subsp. abscessus]|nr:Uncharacterised protein [Mycobacteroides abscessus subsp. abscessus]SKU76478.1 Uncharacterised protein [Mycobacteroides abscessus subsp. abscessus]SKV59279.1 Uncharacterised protein [Mycobacteroides abscessus subsp. abscessus]
MKAIGMNHGSSPTQWPKWLAPGAQAVLTQGE